MTRLGHSVTSVVRTHRLAVKHARNRPPKLILADVHLADGSSGIDAVNEILTEISVPVIFITAYPERLLTGMRPEPTFVITKPFRTEEIQAVVGQALFFDMKSRSGLSNEALASELVEGRMSEQMYESV
jgi:CheY-like chemotaxis protein